VKALQSELQAKGYDVGRTGADGKYGPNTHAALQKMLAGEKPAPKPAEEQPTNNDKKNPVPSTTEQPAADSKTAVYDVSSGTVTLPDGTKLEAHSGRGTAQDDPNSQKQRNRGTTPTGTYKLTPREARYHGVAALRLTPINGTNTHGRDGFLAHSYMLGPKGESHGCVVFKNYPAFLKAYNSGQINQIKIVP
jgi:peptidoglycan hydrolase-like protein with peptidoglycan-binding domain